MAVDGQRLAELRTQRGFSQAELAEKARCSQQLISQLERGGVSTKLLPRIAKVLGAKAGDLDPDWEGVATGPQKAVGELFRPNPPPQAGEAVLPVYAAAEGGEGAIIVSADPFDYEHRPVPLAAVKGAYGILLTGESMVPRYRPGDILLVHPYLLPRPDDGVLLYTGELAGDVRATCKEFVRGTHNLWVVRRYRPRLAEIELPKKEWPICHVVIGSYSRR